MSLAFETYNTKHKTPIFHYSRRFTYWIIGLGVVLFQVIEEIKKKIISYNSRLLNPQEQSTLDQELLDIVHALQIYDFLIIVSPHQIHTFIDH